MQSKLNAIPATRLMNERWENRSLSMVVGRAKLGKGEGGKGQKDNEIKLIRLWIGTVEKSASPF